MLIAVSNKLRSKLVISHPDAEIISVELCVSPKKLLFPVFMYRQTVATLITLVFLITLIYKLLILIQTL